MSLRQAPIAVKPAVRGRLWCATDFRFVAPQISHELRHSMPEKTNPDSLQIETARVQGTFQAGGPPRLRKLPNVGTGQLLPLMGDLSHVPICPMNCERSVAWSEQAVTAFTNTVSLERDVSASRKEVEQTLVTIWPVGITSPAGTKKRPRRGWITFLKLGDRAPGGISQRQD